MPDGNNVTELRVVKASRAAGEDHPGNHVLVFLRNVRATECSCGDEDAHQGRDIIHKMARNSLLDIDEPIALEEVAAVLRYLGSAELLEDGERCPGCGGGTEAIGMNTLFDWLAAAVRAHVEE